MTNFLRVFKIMEVGTIYQSKAVLDIYLFVHIGCSERKGRVQ